MTENLLQDFMSNHVYDIRVTGNGRWIDQKCAFDTVCFVADCVVDYLRNGGTEPFESPQIWHREYSMYNVQRLFGKPDPTIRSTLDEYNKFFRQPLKMLSAAGVLSEEKVGITIHFSVENLDVLEFIALRERNALDFMCMYIEKTLKDSGLWDGFASFFDEQTPEWYDEVKSRFEQFCIRYTPINKKTEADRIFIKVLNQLAFKYRTCGTIRGRLSRNIITLQDIVYNKTNWYDELMGKNKVRDRFSIGHRASAMHHIFPKGRYPHLAMFYENIIALTTAQHMQEAHPSGNTRIVDRQFQYVCLIAKTDSIRRNLLGLDNTPEFYNFDSFMYVLDEGLQTDYFQHLSFGDFNSVVQGIEINY